MDGYRVDTLGIYKEQVHDADTGDAEIVSVPPPDGLFSPKWTGKKWMEGDPAAARRMRKEQKQKNDLAKSIEHELRDIETDADDTPAGIIRRLARVERILSETQAAR